MTMDGQVAIVTGAARGIGKAIAFRFMAEGATVALVDRDKLDETVRQAREFPGTALPISLDITDNSAVDRTFDKIASEHGGIDVLVNNAGIIARGTIETLDHDTWRKVIEVNVTGTFNCCKAAVPHMIRRNGGRILNVTSIAGKMGDITAAPAYGTSKGAVNTLTKSLARQLAHHRITVNAVAPHAVETDMSAEWSDEKRREVIDSIPLGRLATPEEIAEAVLFLVSPNASFITGETLNINGGALMD